MASPAVAQHTGQATARRSSLATPPVKPQGRWASLTLAHRYMLASLLILVASMAGLGWWVGQQIEHGVVQRTGTTTTVYLESFVAPHLQTLGHAPDLTPEEVETLDRLLSETQLGRQVVAFKVWGPHGRVVYSPLPEIMGRSYPVSEEQARAWRGEISARISDLAEEENTIERQYAPRLLEIYSPIFATRSDRIIAVAEFYQQADGLRREAVEAQQRSWLIVGLATAVMYLLLAGIVQRGSDTIGRQRRELEDQVTLLTQLLAHNEELSERVRLAASRTTALNERYLHRVSAELHDGPAQDLSYALLRLDSVVANPAAATSEADLAKIQMSLNRAMSEVRAISAGLRLPELTRLSLTATIGRVIQLHERRTETRVSVSLDNLPAEAPLPVKITIFRVIEEALNNAYRHAAGRGQQVSVRATEDYFDLVVSDQGPGFSGPPAAGGAQPLGLLGMRERVESLGGLFRVDSLPGQGTRIVARLPRRLADEPERS